jgi:hypothetical protein
VTMSCPNRRDTSRRMRRRKRKTERKTRTMMRATRMMGAYSQPEQQPPPHSLYTHNTIAIGKGEVKTRQENLHAQAHRLEADFRTHRKQICTHTHAHTHTYTHTHTHQDYSVAVIAVAVVMAAAEDNT